MIFFSSLGRSLACILSISCIFSADSILEETQVKQPQTALTKAVADSSATTEQTEAYPLLFSKPPIKKLTVLFNDAKRVPAKNLGHDIKIKKDLETVLSKLPFETVYITDHDDLPRKLADAEFVLHFTDYGYTASMFGFYTQIVGLLERMKIPFSNAGSFGMVACVDKFLIHEELRLLGMPSTKAIPFHTKDLLDEKKQNLFDDFSFPGFLKSRFNGDSFGILGKENIVRSKEEIRPNMLKISSTFANIDIRIANLEEWILVKYLEGPEYTVGIVGNGDELDILPIGELNPGITSRTSESNNVIRDSEYFIPARLSESEEVLLKEYSKMAFKHFGCRDYVRFDYRKDSSGQFNLMDINSLPSNSTESSMARLAYMRGQTWEKLIFEILNVCFKRAFQKLETK